jgi:hypothetical protein
MALLAEQETEQVPDGMPKRAAPGLAWVVSAVELEGQDQERHDKVQVQV